MSKQDRVAARTAEDVERKYNFGKTFAEVFGLAEDARKSAETAQQAADNATQAVENLDQTEIFNLLTNNGELKGLFMKDGELYINASYLATGVIKSENGKLVIDLSGVTEPTFNTGISTNGLTIRADEANARNLVQMNAKQTENGVYYGSAEFYSTNGKRLVYLVESFADSSYTEPVGVGMVFYDQNSDRTATIVTGTNSGVWLRNNGVTAGRFVTNQEGIPMLELCDSNAERIGVFGKTPSERSMLETQLINGRAVSWKDNGDGTFTLIGQ